MKDIKSIIAKNLSDLRKDSGLTQAQLAEKISYSDKAISKWERGDASIDIETLFRLADIFNVDINFFFQENAMEEIDTFSTNKMFLAKKIGLLILILMAILAVSLSFFIMCHFNQLSFKENAWVAFVWTSAIWSLVSYFYCVKNKFIIAAIILISSFVWTLLTSIFLTFLVCGINFWMIFLIGVPIQIAILVYRLFKVRSK